MFSLLLCHDKRCVYVIKNTDQVLHYLMQIHTGREHPLDIVLWSWWWHQIFSSYVN